MNMNGLTDRHMEYIEKLTTLKTKYVFGLMNDKEFEDEIQFLDSNYKDIIPKEGEIECK